MIRQSIVRKLWLTIVGLVLVVLLILALYLAQFFASYVQAVQRHDLLSQTNLVGQLLERQPTSVLESEIGKYVESPFHSRYYLVPPPSQSIYTRRLVSMLSPSERYALAHGQAVIPQAAPLLVAQRGVSAAPAHLYALTAVRDARGRTVAFAAITESSGVSAGDPARTITSLIIFAVVLGTLLTTGLAFVVSKNLSQPLIEMNEAATEMAKGHFDMRVRVVTKDEVGRLGHTFNHVASELERSVRALRQEKEEVAGILAAMTDAVLASDLTGQVTLLNPAAIRQLGPARQGTDDGLALPLDMVDMQGDVVRAHETVVREFNWRAHDLVATMTPLYEPDDPGMLRGTLAVVRDVTEERGLERLRKDFVANVSHELRTPLALFQGYAEALLDEFGDDPQQRREMTQIIHDESLRMRRLVNDLLDLAQIESGHFSMRYEWTDVTSVARKVARKFQAVCAERGLSMEVRSVAGAVGVCGDADRIEQVLTNLTDNALRHTASGGVAIVVERQDGVVAVRVVDTGEGIAEEDLPFVFERFYKADKARTRSRGGTGLGLAIARNLIRAHGGDVMVESAPGQGTTFSIILPQAKDGCVGG